MSSYAMDSNPARPAVTWPEKDAIASDLEEAPPAQGYSTIKLLTTLVVMLGAAVLAAFIVIGVLALRNANVHDQIDNQSTEINQQRVQINEQLVQINQLQDRVTRIERASR